MMQIAMPGGQASPIPWAGGKGIFGMATVMRQLGKL